VEATPILSNIAAALHDSRLEAVLIGNAAAALNGAPVTTLDFDFMVRDMAKALPRIRDFATRLNAQVVPPQTAVSNVHSVINEDENVFVDFLDTVTGIKSFASLRSRATDVRFGAHEIVVASLQDVLASKRAANRPKDKGVLELLQGTLDEQSRQTKGKPDV